MTTYSYATLRKIGKLTEHYGEDWKDQIGSVSIDAAYNALVGDTRKNLFCKIDANAKNNLDAMVDHHHVKMAEFVEQLIAAEWKRHRGRLDEGDQRIISEFGG